MIHLRDVGVSAFGVLVFNMVLHGSEARISKIRKHPEP